MTSGPPYPRLNQVLRSTGNSVACQSSVPTCVPSVRIVCFASDDVGQPVSVAQIFLLPYPNDVITSWSAGATTPIGFRQHVVVGHCGAGYGWKPTPSTEASAPAVPTPERNSSGFMLPLASFATT